MIKAETIVTVNTHTSNSIKITKGGNAFVCDNKKRQTMFKI